MESRSHSPTRSVAPVLTVATLLCWGWMTEMLPWAVGVGVLVMAARWVRWRWDFSERNFVAAWTLSCCALLGCALVMWLNGMRPEQLRHLISWLPLFLSPLLLAQCYAVRPAIPLSTFSYLARRRRAAGQVTRPTGADVDFTVVHGVLCLLFASAGQKAQGAVFFPVAAVLVAWLLLGTIPAGWRRDRRWWSVVGVALLMLWAGAFLLQQTLRTQQQRWLARGGNWGGDAEEGRGQHWQRSQTRMGHVGNLQLSPQLHWRLRVENGTVPRLLRTASYNWYSPLGQWRYDPPENVTQEADFTSLSYPGLGRIDGGRDEIGRVYRAAGEVSSADQDRTDLPRFSLRGEVAEDVLVPLPGDYFTLWVEAQDMEKNSIGSTRVTPRHAVLDVTVRWHAPFDVEQAPFPADAKQREIDLLVPLAEREMLESWVQRWQLREGNFEEKMRRLRLRFTEEFRYSTWQGQVTSSQADATVIRRFLQQSKTGHCEHFASAATLMLRQAGIPARYTVGYAVQEYDPQREEWLLRGRHAHAWVRAWDAASQRWRDIDVTPAAAVAFGAISPPWWQGALDTWQRWREDFTVWRTQEEHRAPVMIVVGVLVTLVLAIIARELWRGRKNLSSTATWWAERSPLSALESLLERHVGPRPVAMSLREWLRPLASTADTGDGSSLDAMLRRALELHQRLGFDPDLRADDQRRQRDIDELRQLCGQLRPLLRPLLRRRAALVSHQSSSAAGSQSDG